MDTSSKDRILVIEDDPEIRDLISIVLIRAGYTVKAVENAEAAKEVLAYDHFGLIVLDWMLPAESGTSFLVYVRRRFGETISVLMVTAKSEPQDIVYALDLGADDYLVKPFDVRILVARANGLLKRLHSGIANQPDQIIIGPLKADQIQMSVELEGKAVSLTSTEFRLLWVLITNPDKVLSRERILRSVLGDQVNVIDRTVDTHLFFLRKKLAPWSDCIITVRGIGYRFSTKTQ